MNPRDDSIRTPATVFGVLLILLAVSVAAAWLPWGNWGAVVALSIAVAKATLIAVYFMHLHEEHTLTRVFAVSGVIWLLLLFTFLLSDYLTRTDVVRVISGR